MESILPKKAAPPSPREARKGRVHASEDLDRVFERARPETFVRVAAVQASQKSDARPIGERKHLFSASNLVGRNIK
jgi:hypothetical protein